MKKAINWMLATAMASAGMAVAASSATPEAPSKMVWSLLTGQLNNQSAEVGIVNYDLYAPQTYTMVEDLSARGKSLGAGFVVGDEFFWYDYTQQVYGYDAGGLYAYDMEEGTTRVVASYGDQRAGTTFCSPTYDYQTGTVYALNYLMNGDSLVTIDLESGEVSKGARLTGMPKNEEYDSEDTMKAIAMNYDGDMYGVSYWGGLFKINPVSGECTLVDYLDFNPEKAIMYSTSLAFDNDTEELYWSVYTWVNLYKELRKININDATTQQVGIFGDDRLLSDFYIPFTVAEAGAPAKVQDFKVEADPDGDLVATLSWTNPTKTFGRGGTLESISKIEVYRNNEIVKTFDNPEVGAEMSYTDNVDKNDLYKYKVVAYNEAGRGDRCAQTKFVGLAAPMPVTNIALTSEGDFAQLSWTAPATGKFDGYLHEESLRYDITRSDGKLVAQDLDDTEFTDESIKELGRYNYRIVAHNLGGTSEEMQSEYVICGPAVTLPATFNFSTPDEANIWTIIDGNGDENSWTYVGWPVPGMKSSYSIWYEYPAHEYLLSPKTAFKANTHYKVTFDATPGNKNIPEVIAVSFGNEPTPMAQDSINQFNIYGETMKTLRADFPVLEKDGNYYFGFVHRSTAQGFSLTLSNIRVEENHDGTLEGKVTCGSAPVADAMIKVADSDLTVFTDKEGKYKFDYLLQGNHKLEVSCIGYRDFSTTVDVKELETVTADMAMEAIPAHKISGKVIDAAGDAVADAKVTVGGYNAYSATTNADGGFEIDGVFEHDAYSITIKRNNLLTYSTNCDVTADTDLGTITLNDNLKAPRVVRVTDNETSASVEWGAPLNDPRVVSYDSSNLTRGLGIASGTYNTIFGNIVREPSLLYGCSFYIMSNANTLNHYSVNLYVLDLDENGQPTDRVLYHNTYVSVTDDAWTTYTLPAPVDCPNGYFIGVAYYGHLSIGIDDADLSDFPFTEGVNCYTADYTTGDWYFLDNTDFKANIAMRSVAASYGPCGDGAKRLRFNNTEKATPSVLPTAYDRVVDMPEEQPAPLKAVEDRIRYNVYRGVNNADPDAIEWKEVATSVKCREVDDSEWASLPQGVYRYGVRSVYAGDELSPITMADSIGRLMNTSLTLKVTTDTPENEAEGAVVYIFAEGGKFFYQADVDANGSAVIPNVWKNQYILNIEKPGFLAISEDVDLSKEDAYTLDYKMIEDRQTPANLIIDGDEEQTTRTLIWNFPDLISEGFEDHPDFEINSPGEIGWQYIDGDGAETGGFSTYEWPNVFSPMAFMIFNPSATEPALTDDWGLSPYQGSKFLSSWAAYGTPNDDWFISPRLYFQEDFKFNFYAKSYDYYNLETIEVAYSETGCEPSDFIMLFSGLQPQGYWMEYSYDVPASAKYVAIHHISDSKRILMIDNVRIGLPSLMGAYYAPARKPSATGAYEIYLDGEKVADTDATSYLFEGLSGGEHTAGVRASYTSGFSDMATINFKVVTTGITNIVDTSLKVYTQGSMLHIDGAYDSATLITTTGFALPLHGNAATHDLSGLDKGVYIVKVTSGDKQTVSKIEVK